MAKEKIYAHICYSALDNCKKPEWSYGEICVGCNHCGRWGDKPVWDPPVDEHGNLIQPMPDSNSTEETVKEVKNELS